MFLMEASHLPATSVSCRNLGKSGLRVSCLGLGELEKRLKGRVFFHGLPPTILPCPSSLLQVPGSHLVLRPRMRYK